MEIHKQEYPNGGLLRWWRVVCSLSLMAFVLAIGAERRRNTGRVMPDEYDERTYCAYESNASTVYGLSTVGLAMVSQVVVNVVTNCFYYGRGISGGGSRACL